MYLSRIQLTEALLEQTQLAAMLRKNSYGMHQLLWDLFESNSRYLYREEDSQKQLGTRYNRPLYYVLSDQPPKTDSPLFKVDCKPFHPQVRRGDRLAFQLRANPTIARHIEGKRRSSHHDVVMDAKYQHLLHTCQQHGIVTKTDIYSGSQDGTRRSIRQGLNRKQLQQQLLASDVFVSSQAREQFFQQQTEAVEQAARHWLDKRGEKCGFSVESAEAIGYLWHSVENAKQKRGAGYSTLDYQGILTVTEADIFLEHLYKGFGRAKRFGCGLMMIRRV